MDHWERRWIILLFVIRNGHVKVKDIMTECEVSDSTVRADLAHLALTFPIQSRRGPNGGFMLADQQHPFAKHASLLVKWMPMIGELGNVNETDAQLMQEAILALVSIRSKGRTFTLT